MKTHFEQYSIGIRPIQREDAYDYWQAALESSADALPFMSWCRADYSLTEAQVWLDEQVDDWKKKSAYGFMIYKRVTLAGQEAMPATLAEQPTVFLGAINIADVNYHHGYAELGYWLRSA
ncbi:MAG: GNAT family N-acetyltransferase, partial [Gammaproteobacteria bacterium]|nr:GNAT family N-acetyltransferase [Gammaproteobacteria bacterium]